MGCGFRVWGFGLRVLGLLGFRVLKVFRVLGFRDFKVFRVI